MTASDRTVPSAALVEALATELRGQPVGAQRAAELAADLQRILGQARAVGEGNDFDAEPAKLLVALDRLAPTGGGTS